MSKGFQNTVLAVVPLFWGGGFYLSARAVLWGAVALQPAALFASSPVYAEYARYAGETTWGAVALSLGLVAFAALYLRRPVLVFWSAVLLAMFYSFAANCFFHAAPWSDVGYVWAMNAAWMMVIALIAGYLSPSFFGKRHVTREV